MHGVATGRRVQLLAGQGSVFGVALRPGWFSPLLGRALSTITDRSHDAREVLGRDLPGEVDVNTVEAYVRAALPEPDPRSALAEQAVAAIAAAPGLKTVEALADQLGQGVRQVQRLFADYVGVGPKWVLRRYRLHEVTQRLAAGERVEWAGLAAELGYADQAHLVRDFSSVFGEPPTYYAKRY